MLIALDYDRTYTLDPQFWNDFVKATKDRGHKIICITMRFPEEKIEKMLCEIIYTSRNAKRRYAEEKDIHVDIWIDDSPHWILTDSK